MQSACRNSAPLPRFVSLICHAPVDRLRATVARKGLEAGPDAARIIARLARGSYIASAEPAHCASAAEALRPALQPILSPHPFGRTAAETFAHERVHPAATPTCR